MTYLEKLNKYILIILLLVWPWQTRYFLCRGVSEYTSSSIYVSDLLVLILFLLFVFRVKQLLEAKGIINYFLFSLIPVALLAIAQFSLNTSWSTKWLGLAKHDPLTLGQVVIELPNGERLLRAYGSFDHPNILGGVLAVALWLLIFLPNSFSSRIKIFLVLLFSTGLFFSFSRAAWFGFLVGLIIYGGLNFKEVKNVLARYVENKKTRAKPFQGKKLPESVELMFVVFLCTLMLSFIYRDLLFNRLSFEGRLEYKSVNERVSYYHDAIDIFSHVPFLGTGYGNYVPTLMRLKPGLQTWEYQPVHNVFVLILVELGLVRFVMLFITIWWLKLALQRRSGLIMTPLLSGFLVSIFIMMLFDHWWWSLHVGLLLIGLLGLIGVKLMNNNKQNICIK